MKTVVVFLVVFLFILCSCNDHYCDVKETKYLKLKQEWSMYDDLIKAKNIELSECNPDDPNQDCGVLSEELVDLTIQQFIVELDMEDLKKDSHCKFK